MALTQDDIDAEASEYAQAHQDMAEDDADQRLLSSLEDELGQLERQIGSEA